MGVTVAGALSIESVNGSPYALAGAGYYAARACSVFADTDFVGCIGRDFGQSAVADLFRGTRVVVSYVDVYEGTTFRWSVKYDAQSGEIVEQEHDYGGYMSSAPRCGSIVSDSLLLATSHPHLQQAVIAGARMCPKKPLVLMDTKIVHLINRYDDTLRVIQNADVVFLNLREIQELLVKQSVDNMRQLMECLPNIKVLVVKGGWRGGLVYTNDFIMRYSCNAPAPIVDPTGAGDVFAGVFAGAVCGNDISDAHSIRQAVYHASRLASTSITATGTAKCSVQQLELAKTIEPCIVCMSHSPQEDKRTWQDFLSQKPGHLQHSIVSELE